MDSLALRTGLASSPILIGSFLTLTHTLPSTEVLTMTRSRSPDRTEDPEAFGHNRHVDAGPTNWSTGMSTPIRDPPSLDTSVLLGVSGSTRTIANAWRSHSQSAFGVTIAGEYSNGFNDCAFWLRGPANLDTLNPDCAFWTNSAAWNDTVKQGVQNFALASMDALMNPFFWTWKVSLVLKLYLGGVLGAVASLSLSRLTIGISAFVPKQRPRAPVLAVFYLSHTTRPKNNPNRFPFPSQCHLYSLFFIGMASLVPRCRARCWVHAQVTAFHASPCRCLDCCFFPIIDWNVALPTDSGSCKRGRF